jgi:hypothetical protein
MARTKPGSTKRNRGKGRSTIPALPAHGTAETVKAGATTLKSAAPVKPTASSFPTETIKMTYGAIEWTY